MEFESRDGALAFLADPSLKDAMANGGVDSEPKATRSRRSATEAGPSFADEFPGASAGAADCMMNLVRITSEVLAGVERRHRSVGTLSIAAAQILAIVEDEPLAPHVIIDRMLVTSGTMTSLLDTLERKKLIERVAHPRDRRKILVRITDAGRDVLDALLPRVHAFSREAFGGLSGREQEELIRLLTKVRGRVGDLREQEVDHGIGRRKARPR